MGASEVDVILFTGRSLRVLNEPKFHKKRILHFAVLSSCDILATQHSQVCCWPKDDIITLQYGSCRKVSYLFFPHWYFSERGGQHIANVVEGLI